MIIAIKAWTLTESEWRTVLRSYVSCRDATRVTCTCRRGGHEIPVGSERVAFAIRRDDGSLLKKGYVCRQHVEEASGRRTLQCA
jgi:hypothetical protein